jgi:hypothetical protein
VAVNRFVQGHGNTRRERQSGREHFSVRGTRKEREEEGREMRKEQI